MNCLTLRYCFSAYLLLHFSVSFADSEAMNRILKQQVDISGFDICHSGGCADVSHVALSQDEWQKVADEFDPLPEDAADERSRIANAIGTLESIVGEKTGTGNDLAGTFGAFSTPGQMDCNDEASNSTTYIKLLTKAGLIRFHELRDTKVRSFFFNGWPHTTASIADKQTGELFAVDSWFYDNGTPAVIIPLEQWKSGWKPADFH
ncbi:MAG TPA: hypothetical protein VFS17_03940 [Methylophilaceae bacterium]|nr:hypothetical protein [Methylophilaceae bacterium]